jgi:hypothetical protein
MALGLTFGSSQWFRGKTGNWNRWALIPFFIYGFLFAADARFGQALLRNWKKALIMAAVAMIIWFAMYGMLNQKDGVDPMLDYDPMSIIARFLKGLTSWFWIVGLLGLAGRLTGPGKRAEQKVGAGLHPAEPGWSDRLAAYAKEAQLPFYVLHQTPLIVMAFYIVQWDISATIKYFVICALTMVVSLVIYDLLVRRTKITRILMGMRP